LLLSYFIWTFYPSSLYVSAYLNPNVVRWIFSDVRESDQTMSEMLLISDHSAKKIFFF